MVAKVIGARDGCRNLVGGSRGEGVDYGRGC